ncbi:MAG: alkene reductase [Fusobacteriaceae bacterium]
MKTLFESNFLSGKKLKNRIVMAPMTRARSTQPNDTPNEMMAIYYGQRSSAGMIISEATQISPQGKGYSFTPGIYSKEQIEGWKNVTKSIHDNGSITFAQLWHVGRMSHPYFHNGEAPVAPSAVKFEAKIWMWEEGETAGKMVDCPIPRALENHEIKNIIDDYVKAAKNAIEAGFDGIEIHGGNGYLVDQFLRTTSNFRTDNYGGSLENRTRFAKEILKSISDEIGPHRVGIKLAPFITYRGMNCPYILEAILDIAKYCQELNIEYIHLSEADWEEAPMVPESFRIELRKIFTNKIIVAGNYTKERAEAFLEKNYIDLVAFGRAFISNPNLPSKLENNLPLNPLDPNTLFGGNEKGYTDYLD